MSKPNVIWIMADQLRADMIACNGDPNANTPNIDALAADGINFCNSISGYPLCCPARGTMINGLYPHKGSLGHEYAMPYHQKTLAHVFKGEGYHTAWVGKWHLDGWRDGKHRAAFHIVPPERRGGFDYWMGYENNNSQYDCYVHGGGEDYGEIPPTKLPGYETDCLTDIFLDHLKSIPEDQPFFAVLSVQPPHNPYVAPPRNTHFDPKALKLKPNVPPDVPPYTKFVDYTRDGLANAYGMIENYDENIGRIIDYLKEKGLYENTHIMFFSDHGDTHGSHGQQRKTNPLEESIRVPFIISGRKSSENADHIGVKVPHLLATIDVAPTTLGLCGIPVPQEWEGFDFSCVCRDPNCEGDFPTSVYLQNVIPEHHPHSVEFPWRGVVTADGWKYVCLEGMPWMLFDLNEDPYELRNVVYCGVEKKKRAQMHRILADWIERSGDKFTLPSIDENDDYIEHARDVFGYPIPEDQQNLDEWRKPEG